MPTILISHNATYTLSVIGPLTTAFKPSSSCFSTLFQTTSNEVVLAPLGLTGCYPSGFSAAFATTSVSLAYYSPGICPSGYAHATPVIDGLLGADETGVYCCPWYISLSPTSPRQDSTKTANIVDSHSRRRHSNQASALLAPVPSPRPHFCTTRWAPRPYPLGSCGRLPWPLFGSARISPRP